MRDPGRDDSSTAAEVLRELLDTPAVMSLIRTNLQARWDESMPRLTRALLEADPEIGLGLASNAPRLINAVHRSLLEAGKTLDRFPPALMREYIGQLGQDLDREVVAELWALYSKLLRRTLWDDEQTREELLARSAAGANQLLGRLVEQDRTRPGQALAFLRPLALPVLRELDLGLVRQAVEAVVGSARAELPGILGELLADPVLVANLLGCLPPLANGALSLTAHTLSAIDLPSEVLASGVLGLLGELDPAAIGGLINELSATIQSLHTGSLLLGRHEPRLRAALTGIFGDVVDRLDLAAVVRAAAALAEDAETAIQSAGDTLFRDRALLVAGADITLSSAETIQRGAAGLLDKLAQLPDEAIDELADTLAGGEAPRATGGLVDAAATLAERILGRRPDLPGLVLDRLLGGVERDRAARVMRRLAKPLRDLLAAELSRRATPEGVGKLLAAALDALGAGLQRDPELLARTMSSAVAGADPDRLQRSIELISAQLASALRRNPALLQALLRPLFASLPGALLHAVRAALGLTRGERG